MIRDNQVFDIIKKERERQLNGIELIASENFVSDQVLEAMGSVMTNKYAEGYPGRRYYGGCQFVDMTEQLAIDRLKKLFNAQWANVQPHSGAQANAAVLSVILKPGDVFLGLDLSHGGHLSHGSPVNSSGILYSPVAYRVKEDTGLVDYDEIESLALKHRPKLIIGGASAYSREWDYKKMREIADKVGAMLMVDMAHPAGLIAVGLLDNPLKYAHVVTSTTHKTLRGPRGGLILCQQDLAKQVDKSIFPGIQGGPLMHVIAAKAVCFKQAMQDDFIAYQKQIKKNAVALAQKLMEMNYQLVSGGTDNHLMLIDLRNKGLTGKQAEKALEDSGITVNKNAVPFDTQPPMVTSGIRIGTPAMTTRGMKENEMFLIANLIDRVLSDIDNVRVKQQVLRDVNELCKKFVD